MTASALPPSFFVSTSLMPSASEKAVRQSSHSASHKPGRFGQLNPASRTTVGEQIVSFLRQRRPIKTADSVSADTGVPAGTVQKWLDRGSAPSVAHFYRLVGAYGPDFLAIGFDAAPEWLASAVRTENSIRLKSEIAALEAKLAGVFA